MTEGRSTKYRYLSDVLGDLCANAKTSWAGQHDVPVRSGLREQICPVLSNIWLI
jgi:hypothetical protein